jgi:hypothetical protein
MSESTQPIPPIGNLPFGKKLRTTSDKPNKGVKVHNTIPSVVIVLVTHSEYISL